MPPRKKTKLSATESRATLPDSPQEEAREEEDAPIERFQFPTVRPGRPLIDTYTFHSDSLASSTPASKEGDEQEEEWMLGVDEAGRGPALGPQVYGIAYCKVSYSEELSKLGFFDSKTLTDPIREELFKSIIEHEQDTKYSVTVMSPNDISMGMLRRIPYNLNAQSHDCTINLIREVVDKGYNIKQCFVDTVGPAADYQAKLSGLFPTISFTVCSKADALFPVVSAASIVAKITRDRILEDWTFLEPTPAKEAEKTENARGEEEEEEEEDERKLFGSGYPSDPKTVAWLESNFNPIFGFPNVARFSWAPVKNALIKKGVQSKWSDEPATIQKYFSGEENAGMERTALWKDLNLVSVGEL
ncbi:ribonuclease H2 catalytic subunit RNH201 [Sporobolomyces salmoneus]|uniref:ribonuclease H2 catalytic subunit RNH201 n=1 Tax=Sporobolomyces salmoneus TaxID=183962 RepID=UPI00318088F1